MKWNRKVAIWLSSSLVVGGVVALFVLPAALTQPPPPDQSVIAPPSDQGAEATQVQELLETTYLGRAANLPDPGEPAVVLQKYLEQNAHGYYERLIGQEQKLDRELAVWQALAQQYPQSRHALVGLANHYGMKAKASGDVGYTRQAAEAYIRAAEIALEHSRIRYTREIADLLVELNDGTRLDKVFGRILALPKDLDQFHYYLALVNYADALARLGDDRAWDYFEEAITFHPENNLEAINRYARHLLDWNLTQRAFALLNASLTSEQRVRFYLLAFLRREAMQKAGLDTASADAEIDRIYQRAAEGSWAFARASEVQGQPIVSLAAPVSAAASSSSRSHTRDPLQALKMLLLPSPASAQPWQHNNQTDDCRDPTYASYWWCDWYGNCFATVAVNLAEVIYWEAYWAGETVGAQDTVAWTVRDRALISLKNYCDTYPGGVGGQNTTICRNTLPCSREGYCDLSKWYCCAIHGATTSVGAWQSQINDSHVPWETLLYSGTHWEAVYVMDGYVPELSSGWIPPGVDNCDFGCDGPLCINGSNFYDGAPAGPQEFRGKNYCAGNATDCKWYSWNVCGQNYVPPGTTCSQGGFDGDNFFWNRLP